MLIQNFISDFVEWKLDFLPKDLKRYTKTVLILDTAKNVFRPGAVFCHLWENINCKDSETFEILL
jgi:predicted metal-binding protein